MKSLYKWALPVLVVFSIILINLDFPPDWALFGALALVELLLLALLVKQYIASKSIYDTSRERGFNGWESLENSLETFMPFLLARLLAFEFKLWYYLWLKIFKRAKYKEGEYTYHKKSMFGAFVLLLLFITPAEITIMHIFLPWVWLKWVLVILAVYAFLWMVGVWLSLSAIPHRLEDNGLHISVGILAEGFVPYSKISSVEAKKTENLGLDGLKVDEACNESFFYVNGEADVLIKLKEPLVFKMWVSRTKPSMKVNLAVDDSSGFIKALTERFKPS